MLSESSKTLGRDRLGDNWWLQVWIGVGSLLDPEQYGNWCTILADDDRTRLRPGRISSEKALNVTIGAFIIATIGLLPLSWRSEFYQGPTSQKEDHFCYGLTRMAWNWQLNPFIGLQKRIEGLSKEEAEFRKEYYLFQVIYVDPETLGTSFVLCLGRFGDSCGRASRF